MSITFEDHGTHSSWRHTTPHRDRIETFVGYLTKLYKDKQPMDVAWASRETEVLHLLSQELKECGFPREEETNE